MRAIFDGMRAGVFAALILTLWSFIVVASTVGDAGSTTGMKFVGAAFGFLGAPQIFFGTALGVVVAIWAVVLRRAELSPLKEALTDDETDLRVASLLISVPAAVGLVGAVVMAAHLTVTSGFARVSFQAQGLFLVGAGAALGAFLVSPLIYGAVQKGLGLLPIPDGRGLRTRAIVGAGLVGLVVVLGVAYSMAMELRVWSHSEVQMGLAAVLLVPLLTVVMGRVKWQRGAWTFGIPLAGLAIAVGCLMIAPTWAASTAQMRALTLRDAPLMPTVARAMVDVRREGADDIFSYVHCDEDDEDCGVEEEEAPLAVTSPDHPARRAMLRAVSAGDRAQTNKFESIPDPPKNVVLLVIDTLRQDHMGYAGYHRDTTPNIDALAADSVVFNDAYSTSPHTPRTLPPIFFGRYASNIAWVLPNTNFPRVRPEALSVFEVLQERGWNNISKTSHFYFRERRGLNQGFAEWDNEGAKELQDSHDDIATPRIWERVEATIEDLGRQRREQGEEADPFSLFVHFFDPHARYQMHDQFPFEHDGTNHERLIANYDSEIAHADYYTGKIIDKLKEQDLFDDVIFVITSDHGESFREHGRYFHGHDLYNTVINVPKLVRVPGWFAREVDGQVSVIDIAPTLLDLFGIPIPSEFEGEVLTDVLLGRGDVPDRPVFAELLPYTALDVHHRAVVYNDEKLIVDFHLDLEEFYDLADDPLEQNNLIDERSDDAARLRQMLDEFMGR